MSPVHKDAHGKALALNLDTSIFGTLAEIGAGQEVARWFLRVGAASGTVAQTISAYDKVVSDAIYGAGTRYVSRERLIAMLDYEYRLLVDRLSESRGSNTCFFVFADTIAARNYAGTNEQHGWLGVKFQFQPQSEPSQILLHINLCDPTAQLQQLAVGILGVNLIYGLFHQRSDVDTFLQGLFDELSVERIEIDFIEFSGPAFSGEDAGRWCLTLLNREMAHAVVFGSAGGVVEPSSVLRKRPLIVMRGSFNHTELFLPQLFKAAGRQLQHEGTPLNREPACLIEMTTHHVNHVEQLPASEMLKSIRSLAPRGSVIVSNYPETYRLSYYLRRHSTEPVRFLLGIAGLAKVMYEGFYQALPGTVLEGVGRLLATNVKLYVAPMPREAFDAAVEGLSRHITVRDSADGTVSLDDVMPSGPIVHLLNYLRASGRIVPLTAMH